MKTEKDNTARIDRLENEVMALRRDLRDLGEEIEHAASRAGDLAEMVRAEGDLVGRFLAIAERAKLKPSQLQ